MPSESGSEADFTGLGVDRMASLVAVIESGGFSAAGSALGKSQSRVSVHVAEIERVLGVTLIDRSARPARATESGRVLAEHIRRAFDELRVGIDRVNALRSLDEGEIRIGSFGSATISFLADALQHFRRQYPGVHISVLEVSAPEIERTLASREISLAVRTSSPPIQVPGIGHQSLWRENLMIVVPVGSRLPSTTIEGLRSWLHDRTTIAIGVAPARWSLPGRRESHAADLSPILSPGAPVIYTVHPQALIEMVRVGLGIGVTSSLEIVPADVTAVQVFQLDHVEAQREVLLCWRESGQLSEAERRLRETLVHAPTPPGTLQAQ